MPNEAYEKELAAFKEDSRPACQYGIKCYQKNPTHHAKYKHPPKKAQEDPKIEKKVKTGKKRRSSESDDESSSNQREAKLKKEDEAAVSLHSLSPSPSREGESESESENESKPSPKKISPEKDSSASAVDSPKTPTTKPSKASKKKDEETRKRVALDPSWEDYDRTIQKLFLTSMPSDFYIFYDFCKSLSPHDPSNALKLVDIQLVGPYDVSSGKIPKDCQEDTEKCLKHWRYFYDPPEFQTVLKGNDKDGLHYGYWRDEIDQPPVFVAKNSANKDCTIDPVAPNIFGAVNKHMNMSLAKATPFEKGPISKLLKRLKEFAKEKDISLEAENSEMRTRNRNVVTKTFHGAGIVVPYDKKTQLGYRDLGATDSQLKKILKRIDEAESEEERRSVMAGLEEVIRMATIAADECDFGTCLELAHDLFSSGVVHVQRTALRMFTLAYNLLNRQKFIKIAEAHLKDRKKGCDLSVF